MSIAQTIRQQIGHQALVMIGAKQFTTAGQDLTFKVGRGAKHDGQTVTHIRVTLDEASDLYTFEALRINTRAKDMVKTVTKTEHAYADMLHALIEDATGMYTKLF